VSARAKKLTGDEIRQAFAEGSAALVPVILSPDQLAELLGLSVKTVYQWIAAGRLDGAYRKRGKHVLLWRDRAIDVLFNGPEWQRG
jgi:excisionase family DNA binding protein